MAKKKTVTAAEPEPVKDISALEDAVIKKHMEKVTGDIAGDLVGIAAQFQAAVDSLTAFGKKRDLNIDRADVRFSEKALAVQVMFQLPDKFYKLQRSKAIKDFLEKQ